MEGKIFKSALMTQESKSHWLWIGLRHLIDVGTSEHFTLNVYLALVCLTQKSTSESEQGLTENKTQHNFKDRFL